MFLHRTLRAEGSVWRKSSFCSGGQCVEAIVQNDVIALRDSKSPHGRVIKFTIGEWATFIDSIKTGEFDTVG